MPRNHLNTLLYVSSSIPATNDAAGFSAIDGTFVLVKGLQGFPTFGVAHSKDKISDISKGVKETVKGIAEFKDSTFAVVEPDAGTDPGQVLLEQIARDPRGLCSFKIIDASGAKGADGYPTAESGDVVEYAQGVLSDFDKNEATDSSHAGAKVTFSQNQIEVTTAVA